MPADQPADTPDAGRPRRLFSWRRLWPIAFGIVGALLFGHFVMPQPVELLLVVPEAARTATRLDVRVVDPGDGHLVRRFELRRASADSRTFVTRTQLRRGNYRFEALAETPSAPSARLSAKLEYDGDEAVEVTLESAP